MQCAAIAAQKGHDVVLWEKEQALGGSVLFASRVAEGEEELLRPIRYLEGECRKAGVEILLGQECTPEMAREHGLDALIIASGAPFETQAVPGSLSPAQIIGEGRRPGKRALIIGGEGVGVATAVFLLGRGEHDLFLVEESGRLGRDVSPFYLWRFLKLFRERGVTVLTKAKAAPLDGKMWIISSPKGERHIEVDDVIVALRETSQDLKSAFAGTAPLVSLAGDARRPRRLHNALQDGYRTGMDL